MTDQGAEVNAWVSVVRRAELPQPAKLVALVLASYARSDGTKVYPGLDRLVVECRMSHATARRALSTLRSLGLIALVRRGNRRRGWSDEYRLIIASDLTTRVRVLSEGDEREAIAEVGRRRRDVDKRRHERWRRQKSANPPEAQRVPAETPNETPGKPEQQSPNSHTSTLTQMSGELSINAHSEHSSTLTGDPPTSMNNLQEEPTSMSSASLRSAGRSPDRQPGRRSAPTRLHTPTADLQRQYDAGDLPVEDVVEELRHLIPGGLHDHEESTARGMLTKGAKIAAIRNTIVSHRGNAEMMDIDALVRRLDPQGDDQTGGTRR